MDRNKPTNEFEYIKTTFGSYDNTSAVIRTDFLLKKFKEGRLTAEQVDYFIEEHIKKTAKQYLCTVESNSIEPEGLLKDNKLKITTLEALVAAYNSDNLELAIELLLTYKETVELNADLDMIDQRIKKQAVIARDSIYCECLEKEVLILPHSSTPYCAECGKNIKQ